MDPIHHFVNDALFRSVLQVSMHGAERILDALPPDKLLRHNIRFPYDLRYYVEVLPGISRNHPKWKDVVTGKNSGLFLHKFINLVEVGFFNLGHALRNRTESNYHECLTDISQILASWPRTKI